MKPHDWYTQADETERLTMGRILERAGILDRSKELGDWFDLSRFNAAKYVSHIEYDPAPDSTSPRYMVESVFGTFHTWQGDPGTNEANIACEHNGEVCILSAFMPYYHADNTRHTHLVYRNVRNYLLPHNTYPERCMGIAIALWFHVGE